MKFSFHLLPLMQLLISSATVTAVTGMESSGEGSIDTVLYPYTTVETQTDDPTTTAMVNESGSPSPSESTTQNEDQLQTTAVTEQYAATNDASSATVIIPSTDAKLSSTLEESSTTNSLQMNTEYGTTTEAIMSSTAGIQSEPPTTTTTEASPTTDRYQIAIPSTMLSTITESESASTAESLATNASQSTAEPMPILPPASESRKQVPRSTPTTDQFQSVSAEDSPTTKPSTVAMSTAVDEYSGSLTTITPLTVEPSATAATDDTTTENGAIIRLSTITIDTKSSTLFTPTLEKLQLASTTAVFQTKTKPSPSTDVPPTADMFQTIAKSLTGTDSSAIIQPLTVLFTDNPSTVNEYLSTAEQAATANHLTVTMASNNDPFEPPTTTAVYSISSTVIKAPLTPSILYSTTTPWPSKGSITLPASLQSVTVARPPSVSAHQASVMDLKFSTASYSYLSPTTAKYASMSALVSSTADSIPALKPHNVTQLELMTTMEFPISTDFPISRSSLSNTDIKSSTVANSPSYLKIQPTSTIAKTITGSEPLISTSTEGLHVLVMESSSVTPVHSPTIHDLSIPSKPELTSDILTPPVSQAIANPSVATTTLESPFPTMSMSYLTLTSLESQATADPSLATTTLESPFPTISMPFSTMLASNILTSPVPQKTADPLLATTTLESQISTISMSSLTLTSPESQATADPSLAITTLELPLPTLSPFSTMLASSVLTSPASQATVNPSLATTTLESPTSNNSPVATKFMELSGYETITKSASTMESVFPVESTIIPQTSFESLQQYSITESQPNPRKTSTTEFTTVAKPSIPTNYHLTTTNYSPIFRESSAITESPLTREFPSAIQYPSQVLSTTVSLDLRLTAINDALHASSFPVTSELSTATKSLIPSHPSSPLSSLTSRQFSTEYLITSPQTVLEFSTVSTNPPSQYYVESPLPTLSPIIVRSEPATVYAVSTETSTKSSNKTVLITSPYATVFPTSTKTESQSQSVNESPNKTVNPVQSHSQNYIQLSTPIISPTPASTSDAAPQKPILTTESPVNSNISVTNARKVSNRFTMTVVIDESPEPPPVTESSNIVFPITSDQPYKIPVTTSSTTTTGSLNATELVTETLPTIVVGSVPTKVPSFTTKPSEPSTTAPSNALPTASSPPISGSVTLPTNIENPLMTSMASTSTIASTNGISPVDTVATSKHSLTLQATTETPSLSTLPTRPSTVIELSSAATHQSLDRPTIAIVASTSVNFQASKSTHAEASLSVTAKIIPPVTLQSMVITQSVMNTADPTSESIASPRPMLTIESSPITESPLSFESTQVNKPSSTGVLPATVITVIDSPTTYSLPVNLASTPAAESVASSEFPPVMESLATTESHLAPSQAIKTSSITESMVDAITPTMITVSSMRNESESTTPTQPMLSTKDPPRTSVTSQLMATNTITESQFMKSSIAMEVATNVDALPTTTSVNGSALTMTIDSPTVTPSQTIKLLTTTQSGTVEIFPTDIETTSIDLVTNDATLGYSTSTEPVATTNHLPSRDPLFITDTYTTTPQMIKVSSIFGNDRSSKLDSATLSITVMPTKADHETVMQPTLNTNDLSTLVTITPTAVTPSDSATESPTSPTPLKSTTIPEFGITTNYLATTESLATRKSLAVTESYPVTPPMTHVSTTSEIYQSLTSTYTVAHPSATVLPTETIIHIPPSPSTAVTDPSPDASSSTSLATTKSMNPEEIVTTSQFSMATAANFTVAQITQSSRLAISTTESGAVVPSVTLNFPPSVSQTSREDLNIFDRMPSTTIPTTLGVQATTDENSRLSNVATLIVRSLTTSIANPNMATKSLRPSSSPSVSLEHSDSIGSSISLLLLTTEHSSTSPVTKTTAVISLTPSTTQSSITSQLQTLPSVIVPSATNIKSVQETKMLKSTPVAELSTATRYTSVTESSMVGDSSVAMKSRLTASEMTSSTSMAYQSTGSMLTAVSPSMKALASVTRKSVISIEPTPSAEHISTPPTVFINISTAISLSPPTIEYSTTSSVAPSAIVPSATISKPVSGTGLSTNASPVIVGSPTIQSTTIGSSITGLESQTTLEPSNATESTLIMTLDATVLPIPTGTLLPISTEQLTQSAVSTISPSTTLKSLTDSSVSIPLLASTEYPTSTFSASTASESTARVSELSVTALRSITDSESTAQTVLTTSRPPAFTNVTSSPVLEPLPTTTKTLLITSKHPITATSMTLAENLTMTVFTKLFPGTSGLLVATKSDMQTVAATKSQTSESPVPMEITSKVITATKSFSTMSSVISLPQTSTEDLNIFNSMPPTTTPTTLGVQATTDENSRLSNVATSTIRSLTTSIANPNMATKSLRPLNSPSVTLEHSDSIGSSIPLSVLTTEYSSMSPVTKTMVISLTPSTIENSITSPPQTLPSVIVPSATNIKSVRGTKMLKSTPVAELSTATRYESVTESSMVGDSSVAMKSRLTALEMTSSTSMAHQSTGSMLTAVSPSMTALASVTRKSMEPTPSAEHISTPPTMFINTSTAISLSPATIESMEYSITSSVATSVIVPSATISKPVSERGLLTNASPVIVGSPTIQSTTIGSSITGLESQTTLEPSNATESTLIMTLDATILPIPTGTLLPISTEQLTQSAIPTMSPLTTLKSLTDSSVSIPLLASTEYPTSTFSASTASESTARVSELSVTALRSITDSESTTQTVLTTSRPPAFTNVTSSPVLEPLPTTTKTLLITSKHPITATSMTLAENLTMTVFTKLFSGTSGLLVATKSDMQTVAATKSQTSESPVPMEITSKVITATKSFSTTSSVMSLPQTSTEDLNIFNSMPPTTTPTTLGVQATTDENSRLSNVATSIIRSLTTSVANPNMATKSLRPLSSPSVTLEHSDSIGSSIPLLVLTTEYSSTSPVTKTMVISLTPSTIENSITSPPQTLPSVIVPSATNIKSIRGTKMLKSTPVAELSTATRYTSVIESSMVGDSSVAMKSHLTASEMTSSTSMAYQSTGSMLTAVSPSMTALASVTRKSVIFMEPTPSAEHISTTPTMFITTSTAISLSPATIESIEYSITSSVVPPAIVPSATISKPISRTGLFTNASPVIMGSPTVQSTTVGSSIKGLESQTTLEPSNATESTLIMTLDATILPIPTGTLLPISTEQLTQSAVPTISPSTTLKSLTDSSVSIPLLVSTEYPTSMFPASEPTARVSELSVTALRSITDSESTTILTQTVLTTSRPPAFTNVTSSPILELLPTTTKTLLITSKHPITATLMTLTENLTMTVFTKLFSGTSGLLVATKSDMQTVAATKSQTSESPVSMEIISKLITATKSFSTSSVISLPQTSREDLSIFDSMSLTTTPTTLGVQASTDENSRLSKTMVNSGSMLSAVSPSIPALPSVTRKSTISMELTPSATNTPPSLVFSTSLHLDTSESTNSEAILTTTQLSTITETRIPQSSALEATVMTKSASITKSYVVTPSVTLDLPPTVITSSLISLTNPSALDSTMLPAALTTSSVIQPIISKSSNIVTTPTVIESERTVEPSNATITTLLSATKLPTSDSTAKVNSSSVESKISATLKSTITVTESITISSSKPKSFSMPSLLTSPLKITRDTVTGSLTTKLFPTATEIHRPTATFSTSSNIAKSARFTVTNTDSQVIAMENTMTTVTTKSLTLSIVPSMTLESSDTILSSILPSLLTTEYSSTSPVTVTTAAAISSSPSTIIEYSITASATPSSMIMPSALVSESTSEMRLLTKSSSDITVSPTTTKLQSMTVHTSTTGLESAGKQKTTEPSNGIQSTFRPPVATMLPESTESLLSITMMSLTIMTTTDSIRIEGESPTVSGLLVSYTGSLNNTSTITVGSNTRLPSTSESSSLSFSKFAESSLSRIVTGTIAESQTTSIQTAHPSAIVLSRTRGSLSIIQSSIQTISPSTTLKSLTDSSVSTVTAFRSVMDSESTTILTQIAPTRSNSPGFITVTSSPILEPPPTTTKALPITSKHSTAVTLVTFAESPTTAGSTKLFPATSGFLVTTESVMQTISVTKSQTPESSVSLESMSKLIAATISPLSTDREIPTITESLLTIRHSSIKEYSLQTSEPLVSVEVTVHSITATNPLTITPSMSIGAHTATEASLSPLRATSNSDFVRSSTVIKITNSLKPTPLQPRTPIVDLTMMSSPSTTESLLSTSLPTTPDTILPCGHQVNTSKELGITFIWPETPVNSNATFKCPKNSAIELTRECTAGGKWGEFDKEGCGVLARNFSDLAMGSENLTNSTLEKTADMLSKLVEESLNNLAEQSTENMNEISNALINVANYVNTSKPTINETVIGNIVKTLDSLLQWTPSSILTNSSSKIIESFENVTSQYAQSINATINFINPSVSITAENMPAEILQQNGRNLAFDNRGQIKEANTKPGQLSSEQQAAINLPASLFNRVTMPNVGMFFGLYENATLFPVGGASTDSSVSRQPQVCSHILSATVGQNIDLRELDPEDSVMLTFRLDNKLPGVYVAPNSERCVSWDFSTQNWTEQGCSVTQTTEDGVLVCRCNHLTNFAILVDMCRTQEDCLTLTTMVPTTQSTETQLSELNNSFTNLTNDTYGEAVMMLANIVGGTENSTANQNDQVLKQVADYFSTLATFVNDSNVNIDKTVVNDVVQVVSSLIQWEPENVIGESSSSVVKSFEMVIALYAQQLDLNETAEFILPSLTLVAESRSVDSLVQEGRSFTIGNNQAEAGPEGEVMPGQLEPTQDAAVNLPASLFQQIDNRTTIGIFFALYDTPTLFPINEERSVHSNETDVGSSVLSITVGPGLNFQELEHNITIILRLTPKNFTVPDSERCVSWDFNSQDWTTDGCTTHVGQDGIVSCSCNHLTNFAVLVDICLRQEDCKSSKVGPILTFVSYIGMSVSIVFLVITIITLFVFKEVRQKDISKYHIQLALAILLMLGVSFVLIATSAGDVTVVYGGCMTVSVLVHYFTLVSVMWMGAEALLMFQKLVYVFYKITTKFIIFVSIVCWTVPSIFVAIPLIVDLATGYDIESDIIVKRANNSEDISYCFLSHVGAFWGAFLGPIFIVMLFNIFIFIRVIIVMVRHTRDTAARLNKPVSNKTIGRLMISISGVMFLFGLTWLFAVLTFSVTGLRETFQILFVVFNSFQGLFIFFFVCILNKEVIESWREVLSCGRYQSKLLHPTPVKVVAVRRYQANTDSTGFGSSSGGKYNSETLKSGYDSSTLSIQNVQQLVRAPKPDTLSTETATSDRATAPSTTNAATINQKNGNSDRGETTQQVRKKSVVKIEVVEELDGEGNHKEKSSKNTTKKHTVRIDVVEEV